MEKSAYFLGNYQNKHIGKKILVITQSDVSYVVGGASTVFCNFCNLLAENGFNVTGACYSTAKGRPVLLAENVSFVNLMYEYGSIHSYKRSVNKFVKESCPDLIIFFFPHLYAEAKLKAKFDYIPRILMFHSRPDVYFAADKTLKDRLEKVMKNTVSQILCNSFWHLLPDFIKNTTVVTIPNFVDLNHQAMDVNVEKKRIIYLSRIDSCKGLEFLINSYKYVANKYPEWQLHIYGHSHPEQYVEKLTNMTKRLKLDKCIIFKGITDNPFKTFLNYDFCVFPSFYEGFGMGLAEAQSVGLPAIGLAECSGVNEIITDGYNGFLAARNYKEYAEKIKMLISDKNLRKEFSHNAISSVRRFDRALINSMWIEVINNVLAGSLNNIPYRCSNPVEKATLIPISEIMDIAHGHMLNLSLREKIFSIQDSNSKKHKIILFMGIKFKIRNRQYLSAVD